MKTKFLVYGLIILFGADQAVAAPALLPINTPTSAQGSLSAEHIGVVAGVKGNVQVTSPGQVGKVVSSGEPIRLGDEISTGPEGNLQILLLDQTVFTIGPNSSMKIDKFVYDPSTHNGEVKAEIIKGLFRFVTGKIAKKKPENMEVKLPTGTIGVRGTMVMGEVAGKNSTAVLLGPGEKTNTGSRIGRFILKGETDGGKIEQTEVSRPGFGASMNESGVSRPFQVPPQDLARMTQGLEPAGPPQNQQNNQGPQGQNPQGGPQGPQGGNEPRGANQGSVTRQAGQDTAGARGSLGVVGQIGGLFQGFRREGENASQQGFNNTNRIMAGATTRDQLQTASQSIQGVFHYSRTGISLFRLGNNVGSYDFQFDIDFGSRKVGGGNSKVIGSVDVPGVGARSFQFDLSSQDFGSGPGPAVYQYNGLTNSYSGTAAACVLCSGDVSVGLQNLDGKVAGTAQSDVTVRQLVSTTLVDRGSGGGGGIERQDGPS